LFHPAEEVVFKLMRHARTVINAPPNIDSRAVAQYTAQLEDPFRVLFESIE